MDIRSRIIEHRRVRASELALHPENTRGPDDELQTLDTTTSLETIGQFAELVVRELPDGRLQVIDGHLRTGIAGDAEVDVGVTDLNDEEALRAIIAIDQLAKRRPTDERMLLAALEKQDDYDGLGVTEDDAKALAEALAAEECDDRTDDFDPEAEPEGPVYSKRGEVYQLGRHRVMCGDATVATDVEKLLDGAKPLLCVTDPPYGMGYKGYAAVAQPGMDISQQRKVVPITGDDAPFDPGPALKLTGCSEQFVWGGDWFYDKLPGGGSWVVWDKRASEEADAIPGSPFEVCWSKKKHGREFIRRPWGGWNNKDRGDAERWHPTQKPLECMGFFIDKHSTAGGMVLDPFLGSGTTLIAAEKLGRTCYGMEIEPRYVDVIRRRYANFVEDDSYLPENSAPAEE